VLIAVVRLLVRLIEGGHLSCSSPSQPRNGPAVISSGVAKTAHCVAEARRFLSGVRTVVMRSRLQRGSAERCPIVVRDGCGGLVSAGRFR